jgi:hypothetical protein
LLLQQQQQAKSPMGTVIRIERNQSERMERKEMQNGEQEADDGLRMMPKGIKMPIGQKAGPKLTKNIPYSIIGQPKCPIFPSSIFEQSTTSSTYFH